MKLTKEVLTVTELTALKRCEQTVAKHEKSAIAYVNALREIRDKRLYREKFKTFEEYCAKKWGKSYRAINMAIQAETIRQEIGKPLPKLTDKAALALKNIEPSQRKSVVEKLPKRGKKPATSKQVREAAGLPAKPRGGLLGNYTDRQRAVADLYTSGNGKTLPNPVISDESVATLEEVTADTKLDAVAKKAAVARIEFAYEHGKEWFNKDGRTPRQIVERIISAIEA